MSAQPVIGRRGATARALVVAAPRRGADADQQHLGIARLGQKFAFPFGLGDLNFAVRDRTLSLLRIAALLSMATLSTLTPSAQAPERPQMIVKLVDDFEVTGAGDNAAAVAEWVPKYLDERAVHLV